MTEEELKDLAQAMHDLQYAVLGTITEFEMRFKFGTAIVKWSDDDCCYKLDYIQEH